MVNCSLSPEEVTGIVRFLGYGRLSAPIWFIGMEEGLGGMSSTDTCMNLKARATFERTMDLREAHLKLLEGGIPIDIETNTPSTQVWRFMAKIMLARSGKTNWIDQKEAKDYVRFQLGRAHNDGMTFLTELSPVPAKSTAGKEWIEFFRDKDPDFESKLTQRNEDLKKELKHNKPSLVVCYGLNRSKAFAELLDVEFRPALPKVYISNDSSCLLLPFFGQGQMSSVIIEGLLDNGLLK